MSKEFIDDTWGLLGQRGKAIRSEPLDFSLTRADRRAHVMDRLEEKIQRRLRGQRSAKRRRTPGFPPAMLTGLLVFVLALTTGCSSTDAGLTAKVKSKLAADSTVSASRIDVDTENKVTTLTGSVNSQAEKNQAIQLAQSTSGVRDVVDRISVRNEGGTGDAPEPDRTLGQRVDDAQITMAVKASLLDDPQVKGLRIDVDTRGGIVYLTGSVRSNAERDRAIQLARATEHVREVVTDITIEGN